MSNLGLPDFVLLSSAHSCPIGHEWADERKTKLGNPKSVRKKSKPAAKIKNRNRDDELPSPPDCSGDTLAETGHVPAFLSR